MDWSLVPARSHKPFDGGSNPSPASKLMLDTSETSGIRDFGTTTGSAKPQIVRLIGGPFEEIGVDIATGVAELLREEKFKCGIFRNWGPRP